MENILVSISIVSSSFGVQKGRRLFKSDCGLFSSSGREHMDKTCSSCEKYEAYFEVPYTLLIWQIVFL